MAAGIVYIVENVGGVMTHVAYWSSDGTTGGTLTPIEPSIDDKAFVSAAPLTVGAANAEPGRAVAINCSVRGNVNLKMADGSSFLITVEPGLTILPFAVLGIQTASTTATAQYSSLT